MKILHRIRRQKDFRDVNTTCLERQTKLSWTEQFGNIKCVLSIWILSMFLHIVCIFSTVYNVYAVVIMSMTELAIDKYHSNDVEAIFKWNF